MKLSNQNSMKLACLGGKPIRKMRIKAHATISKEAISKIQDVLLSGELSEWYGGSDVKLLEKRFSERLGNPDSVAVNSGTSALHAAYVVAGLKAGDEIIIPCSAYISAASAAIQIGAIPVFCDIAPFSLNMNVEHMTACITNRTKLIVPVHLYGCPTDMEAVMKIARETVITVIEDCAQALGASLRNSLMGSFGDFSCFSFNTRKHIFTGQGGMVTARKQSDVDELRKIVNKGKGDQWVDYQRLGFSYAMPEINAIIALDGLDQLDEEINRRRRAFEIYRRMLENSSLLIPPVQQDLKHIFFKLLLQLPEGWESHRDFFVEALNAENIAARQCFPCLSEIQWVREYLIQNDKEITTRSECNVGKEVLSRAIDVEAGPGLTEDEAEISAQGILKVWAYIKNITINANN